MTGWKCARMGAVLEQTGGDLGVRGTADVDEQRAGVRLGGGGGVETETVGQPHGRHGGPEAVPERKTHAEIGGQQQGRDDPGRA